MQRDIKVDCLNQYWGSFMNILFQDTSSLFLSNPNMNSNSTFSDVDTW